MCLIFQKYFPNKFLVSLLVSMFQNILFNLINFLCVYRKKTIFRNLINSTLKGKKKNKIGKKGSEEKLKIPPSFSSISFFDQSNKKKNNDIEKNQYYLIVKIL